MANEKYVTSAKPKIGGAVYNAVATTPLPENASSALNASFKALGYCGEDGLVNNATKTFDAIKAWGGDTVEMAMSEFADTFTFTLIETLNEDVLKAVHGDANVTVTGTDKAIKFNSTDVPASEWVFDMVLKGGVLCREVIPNGKIAEIGEFAYRDNEVAGYAITLRALPDASGNTHYRYLK